MCVCVSVCVCVITVVEVIVLNPSLISVSHCDLWAVHSVDSLSVSVITVDEVIEPVTVLSFALRFCACLLWVRTVCVCV